VWVLCTLRVCALYAYSQKRLVMAVLNLGQESFPAVQFDGEMLLTLAATRGGGRDAPGDEGGEVCGDHSIRPSAFSFFGARVISAYSYMHATDTWM